MVCHAAFPLASSVLPAAKFWCRFCHSCWALATASFSRPLSLTVTVSLMVMYFKWSPSFWGSVWSIWCTLANPHSKAAHLPVFHRWQLYPFCNSCTNFAGCCPRGLLTPHAVGTWSWHYPVSSQQSSCSPLGLSQVSTSSHSLYLAHIHTRVMGTSLTAGYTTVDYHCQNQGSFWNPGVIAVMHFALVRPHQESCVQPWTPPHRTDMDLLERVQRRPRKWSERWSTSAVRTGWESWGCSAWRREGSEETL